MAIAHFRARGLALSFGGAFLQQLNLRYCSDAVRSVVLSPRFGERNSDVVSFHSYGNLNEVCERLDELAECGPPLLCSECLARHHASKFASHLPLFRERNVGIHQWGMVAGRTQTYLHWYTPLQPGAGRRAAPVAARRDAPRRLVVRPGRGPPYCAPTPARTWRWRWSRCR